jgi:hypothetical protein
MPEHPEHEGTVALDSRTIRIKQLFQVPLYMIRRDFEFC